MDVSTVNPNVLFGGFLALIILSGVGEYMHIVPTGTTSVLVGAVFGGSLSHASFAIGNNQAVKTMQASQASTDSQKGGPLA